MAGLDDLGGRAAGIRLLAMDVDGVLTDGLLWFGPGGEQMKVFNVRDGQGIASVIEAGIGTALISGRDSEALRRRAEELGISDLYLGVSDKESALEDLADRHGLELAQICYIGDDLPDLPVLLKVGLPLTVPAAPKIVKEAAAGITHNDGGKGAVREVCDLLLAAKTGGDSS